MNVRNYRRQSSVPKCPTCGSSVKRTWEAPHQEYAGASVQGGYWFLECRKCDWCDTQKGSLSGYSIRENTRGW